MEGRGRRSHTLQPFTAHILMRAGGEAQAKNMKHKTQQTKKRDKKREEEELSQVLLCSLFFVSLVRVLSFFWGVFLFLLFCF
jgi:hypothetical protein